MLGEWALFAYVRTFTVYICLLPNFNQCFISHSAIFLIGMQTTLVFIECSISSFFVAAGQVGVGWWSTRYPSP
jgi:hypothetical protein